LKRKLTFIAVAVAAVALAGGAYAATQNSGSTSRQAFLSDVAHRLGVKPAQLNSALQGAFFDRLSAAVTAGRLTSAQANAIEQQVKKSGVVPLSGFGFGAAGIPGPGAAGFYGPPKTMRNFRSFRGAFRFKGGFGSTNNSHPAGKLPPSAAFGHRFAPAPGFGIGFGFGMLGGGFGAVASYLGLSNAKLFSELQDGKSLAQVATAQGKTASGLQGAITAAVKARLDRAVSAKWLTSAQEQKLLSHLSTMIGTAIQRRFPAHPKSGFRFGGSFRLPQPAARTKTTG
jgi:hypothetical protein